MKLTSASLLLLFLSSAGCVLVDQEEFTRLRPGRWIEAKGQILGGRPVVNEVDELQRSSSDKKEKVEVTGQTTRATATQLEIVGLRLTPDVETEYEDQGKRLIPRFVPQPDDWLKVKLRRKDEAFRVRTIREQEPREQFKVEGEVFSYSKIAESIDVGGVKLKILQDADITMLGQRDPNDPLSLFQADDQKAVPFSVRIGDNLILGGQVSVDIEVEDEFDLDKARQRDRTKLDSEAKIDALWLFGNSGNYALVEVNGTRTDRFNQGKPDENPDRESLDLQRAFASIGAQRLQFLFGRQDFDEEREWLYDEVLDGLRGILRLGENFRIEASASQGRDWGVESNDTIDTRLFTMISRYYLDKDWVLAAYVLDRTDDTVFDHEPTLFGVRSIDQKRYGLAHWAELSFARGHTRSAATSTGVAVNREDISGYAFDVGVLYNLENQYRPAFSLSYAYGSGKPDSANVQGYRQTGYQDNNAKLGGVTSVRYYGELLRPELANLAVLTASAAFRPWDRTSISVQFHHYLQDYAAQYAPITDIRQGSSGSRPNGRSPQLGYEVDLVFGYRLARRLTVELVGARFEPGAAFDNRDPANKLDLTVRMSF